MPKLVYDVEFKIGQSSLGGIANELNSVDKAVNTTVSSNEGLSTSVKDVVKNYNSLIASTSKLSTAIDLELKASENSLRVQARSAEASKKRIDILRVKKKELQDVINSTELTSTESAKLDNVLARLNTQEKKLVGNIQNYNAALGVSTDKDKRKKDALSQVNAESKDLIASTSRLTNLIKLEVKQSEGSLRVLARASKSSRDRIKILKAKRLELGRLVKDTSLTKKETALLNNAISRLTNQESQLVSVIRQYRAELQSSSASSVNAVMSTERLVNSKKDLLRVTKNSNKSISAGNQVLFSFSDLIQDSAQFSQGAAQGFRAIGNNIGYTAELLNYLNVRAKAANRTLKQELMSSMMGVGGVMVGLNLAITAGTMLLTEFGGKAKEANQDLAELFETAANLRDFGAFDFMGRAGLKRQIEEIESVKGVLESIINAQKRVSEEADLLSQQLSLTGTSSIVSSEALTKAKITLKSLQDQFGYTADEAQELIDKQEKLQKQFDTLDTRSASSELALYLEALDDTVDKAKLYNLTGVETAKALKGRAIEQFQLAAGLKLESVRSEEARVKMEAHLKSGKDLMSMYDSLKGAIENVVLDLPDDSVANEREVKPLTIPKPPPLPKDFLNEDKVLERYSTLQDLIREAELSSLEGLNRDRFIIEQKYQDIRRDLRMKGIEVDGDLENQLELNKKLELEQAKTEIERQETERRRAIQKTLQQTSFNLASQYIGALSQLNQAQSDETEAQARKKFETQKKLQIASALVNAGQATVRQFSDLPFKAALVTSALVGVITKKQIDAINATEFEGGGSASSSGVSAPRESTGFTFGSVDRQQRRPTSIPRSSETFDPIVNITLHTQADDRVIAMKAENGKKLNMSKNVRVVNG